MKCDSLGVLLCALGCTTAAQACAPLVMGEEPVRISQEAAVIIWDAAHQRQHFIRRATFQTKSRDVGFLVPTPSTPELAEVDDKIFTRLSTLIEPEQIAKVQREYHPMFYLGRRMEHTFNGAAASLNEASVEVVSEHHVAGYDAVVLSAEDSAGLGHWLKTHGYRSSPALLKWLEPYVQKHWKITAFKIPKADKDFAQISSTAVRLSFDTSRPFFPYSEPQIPQSQSQATRWLQVFLFAPQRMTGLRGEAATAPHWAGKTDWADSLTTLRQSRFSALKGLPQQSFAAPQWLTVFNDYSSPRTGSDDVFFAADRDQSRKVPPSHIYYTKQIIEFSVELVGLVCCLIISLAILVHNFFKRERKSSGEAL